MAIHKIIDSGLKRVGSWNKDITTLLRVHGKNLRRRVIRGTDLTKNSICVRLESWSGSKVFSGLHKKTHFV